jgi:hypothetical protein
LAYGVSGPSLVLKCTDVCYISAGSRIFMSAREDSGEPIENQVERKQLAQGKGGTRPARRHTGRFWEHWMISITFEHESFIYYET